jgi:DNA-binding response OmpR family regulator
VIAVRPGEADGGQRALDAGATVLVDWPCPVSELLRTVRASRAAVDMAARAVVVVGPLRLDPAVREVHLDNRIVDLPADQFDVLALLARTAGATVTSAQIAESAPGGEPGDRPALLVRRLRCRLGDDRRDPPLIQPVADVGYCLAVPPASSNSTSPTARWHTPTGRERW